MPHSSELLNKESMKPAVQCNTKEEYYNTNLYAKTHNNISAEKQTLEIQ